MSKLSIIIPFHNKSILKTLNSLFNCENINNCEIILISDGLDYYFLNPVLEKYKHLNLNIIKRKKCGKIGKLRNIGIIKSTTDYCFFVDSDCIFKKNILTEIIKSGLKSRIIKGKNIFKGINAVSKIDAEIRTERYNFNPKFAYCPNLVVKKEIFNKIGLFNEKYYYGSDGEFAKRIEDHKISVIYNEEIIITHISNDSFISIYKKWINYGEGRYLRYKNEKIKKRVNSLFSPDLFRIKKGLSYNLFVFLCLTGRWVGTIKGYFKYK